jgi:tetratricopeptide (TPR) repeat protein
VKLLIFLFLISSISSASSLKKLEKECLQGNLASCVKKEALLSGLGKNTKLDSVIGEEKSTDKDRMKQYTLDCNAKIWSSCYNLAVLKDKTGDPQTAIKMYNRACFKGNIKDSCYNLGVIHNKKKRVKPAKMAFEKACQSDHFVACYNFGILEFDSGNKENAKKLFKKACNGKVSEACQKI